MQEVKKARIREGENGNAKNVLSIETHCLTKKVPDLRILIHLCSQIEIYEKNIC